MMRILRGITALVIVCDASRPLRAQTEARFDDVAFPRAFRVGMSVEAMRAAGLDVTREEPGVYAVLGARTRLVTMHVAVAGPSAGLCKVIAKGVPRANTALSMALGELTALLSRSYGASELVTRATGSVRQWSRGAGASMPEGLERVQVVVREIDDHLAAIDVVYRLTNYERCTMELGDRR